MVDNILILAGGTGTRLWPASLNEYPKQFIKIMGGKSLIKLTVERALKLGVKGQIIIITLRNQLENVIMECSDFSEKSRILILPEPEARNTAPAIAAASYWLKLSGREDETVLVMPADHLIQKIDKFKKNIQNADKLARKGFLVTFGIPPQYPETGYGYIEAGKSESPGLRVKSFREKPDLQTALNFIKSGKYYWNSGIFTFKTASYISELEKHSPEIARAFSSLKNVEDPVNSGGFDIIMEGDEAVAVYRQSPSISIDYAVMEKSSHAAMIKADFFWNDIGSWDQFETIIKNLGKKEIFEVDAENNIVFSDIPVALCEVSNLIVVIKNGKALICRKGSSQKVKEIRKIMEEIERDDLL